MRDCKLLFAAFALFGASFFAALAAPSDPPKEKPKLANVQDLQGYYAVAGTDDGEGYDGIAVIKRHGSIYVVQWSVGPASYMGCGVKQGDTLNVGWAAPAGEGKTLRGVHVFQIGDKRLTGQWSAIPGSGKVHKETLTFLKPL